MRFDNKLSVTIWSTICRTLSKITIFQTKQSPFLLTASHQQPARHPQHFNRINRYSFICGALRHTGRSTCPPSTCSVNRVQFQAQQLPLECIHFQQAKFTTLDQLTKLPSCMQQLTHLVTLGEQERSYSTHVVILHMIRNSRLQF